jgi:hypothetical protein
LIKRTSSKKKERSKNKITKMRKNKHKIVEKKKLRFKRGKEEEKN